MILKSQNIHSVQKNLQLFDLTFVHTKCYNVYRCGGLSMNKKLGRPTECVKEKIIKFRADDEFQNKLDYCSERLNLNRSETLRYSITDLYAQLKNTEK